MIQVENLDIVGLFLFLRKHELELDNKLLQILRKTEDFLFERLTIGDINNLYELYLNESEYLQKIISKPVN